jgi:hypothetical protein
VTSGDFNGDGYGDLVVCAPYYDFLFQDDGKVFVYYGGPGGPATTPDWTAETDQAGALFGISAASGDFNNDTYDDLAIGAQEYDHGQFNEGVVFVWFGSDVGLGDPGTPTNADWLAESDWSGGFLGVTVACAGDVNNDGYDDLIAGAEGIDFNTQLDGGAAYVWLGDTAGFKVAGGTPANAAWKRLGGQAFAYLEEVAGAGDVNGDGYDDVIVGARGYDGPDSGEGRAWLFNGTGSGVASSPAWYGEGNGVNKLFGRTLAGPGDVNADGYDDVLVGGQFGARLFYGSATGLGSIGTPDNADWSNLGARSVAPAGDVNNDGIADVLTTGIGVAEVYLGSNAGLEIDYIWQERGSGRPFGSFGWHAWTAGDVNGDNYDDVIIGDRQYYDPQIREGAAFLYLGATDIKTAAAVQSYRARWIDGLVEVEWMLIDIEGAIDFEVYRSVVGGMYRRMAAPAITRGSNTFVLRDHDTRPEETYGYRVNIVEDGRAVASFETSVTTPAAPIELYPNYPNPFNPSTSIRFSLDVDADVTLAIYDATGRLVRTLLSQPMRSGAHTEHWNGTGLHGQRMPSGVYFLRMQVGKKVRARTIVLMK